MDIHTLQSLIDSGSQLLDRARNDEMFKSDSAIDYNYALGVEHGIRDAIRLLKDALDTELNQRDNQAGASVTFPQDAEYIDFVVRSAIENNSFDGYVSYDSAYDEAAEELGVDHDTLCEAFGRVTRKAA